MPAGDAAGSWGGLTGLADDAPPAGTGVALGLWGWAGSALDGSPIPGISFTATLDSATLSLFDRTGKTKIGNAELVRGLTWQHQLSAPGTITFELPAGDAFTAEFTAKRIVKVYQNGRARMAGRLGDSSTSVAVDGVVYRQWTLSGVLAMSADGLVEPEFGLKPTSGTTRTFGFMSRLDNWYLRSNFRVPQALAMSADTGYRKNFPAGLKALNPSWISLLGAYSAQSANEYHYFHRRARVFSTFDWQFDCAADHRFDLWIDGEQVAAKEDAQGQGYRYLATVRGTWEPGDHVIAAAVQANGPNTAHQPIAFIGAMRLLDDNGNPVHGAPFIVTEPSRWRVTDDVSGHHRAECLLRLWEECNQRLVALGQDGAFLDLHPGWTDTKDSAGLGWSDYGRHTVEIEQAVLDVVQQFCEGHIDVDVDPETMRVLMFKRAGTDRRASVALELGQDGGNVISHTVTRAEPTGNAALMQLADGDWVTDEDSDSIDDYGRAEIGLSVGSTTSEATADDLAEIQFNQTAHPTRVFSSIEINCLFGKQLYKDFFLGDTLTVPNEDGDPVHARLIAGTMDWSGEVPSCQLDFVEDRT